ncbi:MAG: YeeE/YedE thiosulfate transporter family protein [Bacteroidales bacterium]
MGPILPLIEAPLWLNLLAAFLIGILFGFALEQAGFSSSRKLAGMFYGYDTTVLKVFFSASIFALCGSLIMNYLGLIDLDLVYVNEYYIGSSILGGIIMGAGFIMGGFCPGTGICALGIGKIDALFYVFGAFAGAFLFAESYPYIAEFATSGYMGTAKINEWLGVSPGVFALFLILAAVAMFWMAEKAEQKFPRPDITNEI